LKNKKIYKSPKIKNLGDAKNIIKNVFVTATGDTFPGVNDSLASS